MNTESLHRELTSRVPSVIAIVLLFVALLWAAMVGQDLLDMLLEAGMSTRYMDYFTTGNVVLGVIVAVVAVPIVMFLIQQRPALFWGGSFVVCSFSEARFPSGVDFVLLGLRYACLAAIMSFGIYLIAAKVFQWSFAQIVGAILFVWILILMIADRGGSTVLYGLSYFDMFVAIPAVIATCVDKGNYAHSLLKGLTIAALVTALVNASSLVSGMPVYLSGRFLSYFPLPTNFANNFIMAVVILWVAAVWSASNATKVLYVVLFAGACYLILISGTRNALLCVGATVLATVLLADSKRLIAGMFIGVAAALAVAVVVSMHLIPAHEFDRIAVSSDETRYTVWRSALQLIDRSRWVGYGPDLSNVLFFDVNSDQETSMNPHNTYLGFALRFGLVGSAIFAMYLAANLWASLRTARRVASLGGSGRSLLALAVLWTIVLAVSGFFEDNLTGRGTQQQLSFGIAAGLLVLSVRTRVSAPKR